MKQKDSSSLGIQATPSISSHRQSIDSEEEREQIAEYVKNFKQEVENKFEASDSNQRFVFPRNDVPSPLLAALKGRDSKHSVASLENVTMFDLASDNVKRTLKEKFEAPRQSETDFLVDALTSVGKLNREYLHSQIKHSASTPFLKYIYLSIKKKMGKENVKRPSDQLTVKHEDSNAVEKRTLEKQKVKKSTRSISKANLSGAPTADLESISRFKSSNGFSTTFNFPKKPVNKLNLEVKRQFKVSHRLRNEVSSSTFKGLASPIQPTPKLKLSARVPPLECIVPTKSKAGLDKLLNSKGSEGVRKTLDSTRRTSQNLLFHNFIRKMKGDQGSSVRLISNRSHDKAYNVSALRSQPRHDKSSIGLSVNMTKNQIENYVGKLLLKQSSRQKVKREKDEFGNEMQENKRVWETSREEGLKEKLKKTFLKGKKTGVNLVN